MERTTNIGDTVWFKGDAYVVQSAPYMLYGAEWVDAVGDSGRIVTVPSDAQDARNYVARRAQGGAA